MRERLATIRRTTAQTISNLSAKLSAYVTEPATEPADLAMMQEIRTWLRSLPAPERLNQIRKLATEGDSRHSGPC